MEPKPSSQRYLGAPKKCSAKRRRAKNVEAGSIALARKQLFTEERKQRQFTKEGKLKESLRTRTHLCKLYEN